MADLTKEEIVAAVREAMSDHPCRYDVCPKDVDHIVGMILDIGKGDLRAGIECLRQHHLWMIDRLERDEEFAANHEAISGLRSVTRTFGEKVAHAAMWVIMFLCAFALVALGTSKGGYNITDMLRK